MRRAAMPPGAYFNLIVSLRRSVATAAIPWNKVRNIYSVNFHPPGSLLRRFASLAKTAKTNLASSFGGSKKNTSF